MVLLHILNRLASRFDWQLTVAHFNHQLRGHASDADEEFVKHAAEQLGLSCVSERGDVRGHRRENKLSVEMAARALRHEFLGRVAQGMKIPAIALAHHADDQVELFFLRLFRGAGGEGLGGMKWTSPALFHPTVRLVRPLLAQRKAEVVAYANQQKIAYREDASNVSTDILRNRIRHELVPFLSQKYDPSLLTDIVRSMGIIGAEAEYVAEVAERWLANKRHSCFDRLHVAVQRQCLVLQLGRLGVTANFDLVERLRSFPRQRVMVDPGCAVWRDEAGRLHRQAPTADEFNANETSVDLSAEGTEKIFDGVKVSWEMEAAPVRYRKPQRPGCEFFDAAKIGALIRLRHWREGDRFQPIGMDREVKVQDLFTNLKVPRARRRELIVATTTRGEIFWIEGLRIGERFKLDKRTRRRLKWRWKRIG